MLKQRAKHRILIVDDEPDIHAVTRLSLRKMKYGGRGVELASANNGAEALADLREHPETAVVLLDVVMTTETDGLDTARDIREVLGNKLTRILMRTGQPGIAPERKCIDEYDIDGYLPKAELSSTRLYAAVRTALKAHKELVELVRHRSLLSYISDAMAGVQSFEPLEASLQRILAAAATVAEADLTVLELKTYEGAGDAQDTLMHLSRGDDDGEEAAQKIVLTVMADDKLRTAKAPVLLDDGYFLPIVLPRDLGRGWIYMQGEPDALARQVLPILAAHASNALYSTVAQAMLEDREGPFFDAMTI